MNVEVLPLKVLVSRQVVRNRVDYSAFLNGTLKEELDRLDMLAGDFRIEDSRVIIRRLAGKEEIYAPKCSQSRGKQRRLQHC